MKLFICRLATASLAIGVWAGLSPTAHAQVSLPGSYLPLLDAGTPLTGVTGTEFGWADISLNGWTFPYFGSSLGTISVNAQGYVMAGDGVSVCQCSSEAGDPANFVGPGCQDPETTCDSTLPQCGGGCCANSTNNCNNGFCGGGCCFECYPGSPNIIMPFFYDGLTDIGINGISTLQGFNDAGHFLTVDYNGVQTDVANNFNCFTPPCGGSIFQFQVTLQESGDITFAYGQTTPLADAGGLDTAEFGGIGIVNNHLNPDTDSSDFYSANPCCSFDANFGEVDCTCGAPNWPTDSVMIFNTYGAGDGGLLPPPPGPYIVPQPVELTGLQVDAGSVSFALSTQLANVGAASTTGTIKYDVYLTAAPLSVDFLPVCSGAPPCLLAMGPMSVTVPLGDGGPVLAPATPFVVDDPPFGIPSYYYAEIWVDPADALATANPRQSVAISAPLPFGVDLTGSIGAVPSLVSASKPLTIPLTLKNLGLAPSGTFSFDVYLTAAAGAINQVSDFKLPPGGSSSLGPQASTTLDYVANLGAVSNGGVPAGSYFLTLSLPTTGDLNPLNNVISVGPITVSPAHLVVSNVQAPAYGFPGYPTDVSYTLSNTGADDAPVGDGGFSILTLIHPQSEGSHFNRSNEPQMQELDGVVVKAGCVAQITDDHIVSSNNVGCAYIPPVPAGTDRPIIPATSFGTPLAPGLYLVGVFADPFRVVLGESDTEPPESASPTPTVIADPAPDYTVFAGDLIAPPTGVAGEQMAVQTTISNIGILSGSTPYGYFLSAVGEVNAGGVPVPVLRDGGVTYRPQSGTIEFQGSGMPDEETSFDVLLLPSGLPTAAYTLTVAIDPDEVTNELSRSNDLTGAQAPIQISADPLEVVTSTRLPSAEVSVAYSVQLAAEGGLSGYAWSQIGGALPTGFALSPAGVISGTPTEAEVGNYSFLVQVQSGSQTQVVALLLAVTDGSAPLQILTVGSALPPATAGLTYEQQLAAQGGVPPYVWTGNPPGNGTIVLEKSGLLSGTPNGNSVTSGPQIFTVTVTDQIGNSAQAAFSLDVISPATLTITTDVSGCSAAGQCPANLNPQIVGQPMQVEFTAVEPGTHQFTWQFPAGQALPSGVAALTDLGSTGHEGFQLTGTPSQVGVFPFRLRVVDELEHSAERHFVLIVSSTAIDLPDGGVVEALPNAVQGQAYPSTQLTSPGTGPFKFELYSQDLPTGLSLANDGTISGTCSSTAAIRPWAFTVSAIDSAGNQALLPFVIMVQAPKTGGCSTTGGTAALGLALLCVGLWLRRRRALAVAAILLISGGARAQLSAVCTYRVSSGTDPYVDITSNSATTVLSTFDPEATAYSAQILPFPLPTPGGTVFDLYAWSNGAITDISDEAYPSISASGNACQFPFASATCTPPDMAIAPWWGDLSLCLGGSVATLFSGDLDAGTGVVTVQWQNVVDDAEGCPFPPDAGFDGVNVGTYSFQAKLFQSGNLEFIYGNATTVNGAFCEETFTTCSYAAGVEAYGPAPASLGGVPFTNASGAPALGCNADCPSTSFPTSLGGGSSVTFLLGPDVQATALGVSGNVSIGAPATLTAEIGNTGSASAIGATLTVYFSTDGITKGAEIGTPIAIPNLEACAATQPVVATFSVPSGTTASVGYLIGVISDPGDNDAEGKTIVSAPFNILPPEPNYAASNFTFTAGTSGSVAPGGTLPVAWTAANEGAASHPDTTYGYFVSRASTVTPSDLQLMVMTGGAPLDVAPGGTHNVSDVVQLPSTLPPGAYTVGVIIDPGNTFLEQSKFDNLATAAMQLSVIVSTISVATTALPPAVVGVSYAQTIQAAGGDGNYTWSGMNLPMGFSLSPDGTLSGAALTAGSLPVAVTVTDGHGLTASASLSLTVTSLATPLAVVTETLPGAQVDESYEVPMSAIGGTPPYTWCAPGAACPGLPATMPINGVLPPGLVFSADGILSGVPEANGTFAFQVAVVDSSTPPNAIVSLELPLHVTASGSVSVSTSSLPIAQLGVVYVAQLSAAGGEAPVSWSLVDVRRLPSAPGDPGADLQTTMPAGLTLEPATGQIVGTPEAAGDFVLLVEATDSSSPAETATDNVLLQVLPSNGLQILNSSLPPATIATPYNATLDTNAVDSMVTFEPIDTAGHDTPAARATLPPGLTLSAGGQITGTPTQAGNYTFLIEATDSQGRIAIQSFLVPVDQRPHGGCSSSGRGSFAWLALLAVLGRWRRRR